MIQDRHDGDRRRRRPQRPPAKRSRDAQHARATDDRRPHGEPAARPARRRQSRGTTSPDVTAAASAAVHGQHAAQRAASGRALQSVIRSRPATSSSRQSRPPTRQQQISERRCPSVRPVSAMPCISSSQIRATLGTATLSPGQRRHHLIGDRAAPARPCPVPRRVAVAAAGLRPAPLHWQARGSGTKSAYAAAEGAVGRTGRSSRRAGSARRRSRAASSGRAAPSSAARVK